MSEALFNVVFVGVLPGFDRHKAEADFAQLFSLDSVRAGKIFDSSRTILKSGIPQSVANQYISRLAAIGVEAVAEAQEPGLVLDEPDAVVPPAAAANVPQEQKLNFEFNGRGGEYFKIWIVNVLLSIVTLGIYSAWAKVRTHQYFYGNTLLNGSSFEYTAKPLNILKGRIIAFVLLILYSVMLHSSPATGAAMGFVLLLLSPWIIVLSLRFNARYTSYRNISFRFNGTIGGAVKTFVLWPLAGVFSIGILFPFVWQRQSRYIIDNHTYGATPFSFKASVGPYYQLLLMLIGISVGFAIAFGLFSVAFAAIAAADATLLKIIMGVLAGIGYIGFYLFIGAFVIVTMANIKFNNTELGEHRFTANWELVSYTKLLFVNSLFIILTLGLYIPFAKVRTAAYKAEHMQFIAVGDLNQFAAAEKEQVNAVADGVNDLFAMDISI